MNRIEELDREIYGLEMAVLDIRQEVDRDVDIYRTKLLEARSSEFQAIREQRQLLEAERQALIDARDREEIARALQDERVGKIYCKWRQRKYSTTWIDIERKGVVEVLTPELMKTGQKMGYGRTTVGSLVYRYLKADGTVGKVGKRYESVEGWSAWFPEGVDPRKKVGE